MNYLDLFHGIGGFAVGAYLAGMKFENHYCSDIESYLIELYKKRFPDNIQLGDIREIDCEKLMADTEGERKRSWIQRGEIKLERSEQGRDFAQCSKKNSEWIITGGFPCQDISVAGKGTGIRGSRSGLWFEMWRIIRDLRPRFAIMENVGALTFRGLTDILGSLTEIGYDAEWQDIRAEDMGAPHERKRIWIVAYPNGERKSQSERNERKERRRIINGGKEISDPMQKGLQDRRQTGITESKKKLSYSDAQRCCSSGWSTEPSVGRLAHGIPNRVDRLKGLGNAIVPQIAELLFKQIKEQIYADN